MTRMDYYKAAPGAVKAVRALEQYVRASELEPALIELVKVRASLMNGCADCIDIHTKDARANAWNRLAVSFRPAVGSYKPAAATTAVSA